MVLASRWLTVPISLAIAVGFPAQALSQLITIAPNSQPIKVNGISGGEKKDASCAGFIAASPNHIINVTEDADFRFELQSAGQPALLIRSSTGKSFCVPADQYSNGKIAIPGRWQKGTYSIFIGDRANEHHAYTLLISNS